MPETHSPEALWKVTFIDSRDIRIYKRDVQAPNPQVAQHFARTSFHRDGIFVTYFSLVSCTRVE